MKKNYDVPDVNSRFEIDLNSGESSGLNAARGNNKEEKPRNKQLSIESFFRKK